MATMTTADAVPSGAQIRVGTAREIAAVLAGD
jgi:hypothetical protein